MEIKRPVSKQPMPDHAEKVFSGVVFNVWQWEQKLYDGRTTTFEKLERIDSACIIPVLENGNILLIDQRQPGIDTYLGIPGGVIDPGETPLETAKRELMEEVGCEAASYSLFKAYQPLRKIEWAIYIFVAKGVRKVASQNLDGGEIIDLREVTFDEFVEICSEEDFIDPEIRRMALWAKYDEGKKADLKALLS